jgi:hypothetical protein
MRPGTLDYSRWNAIDTSSDEEEVPPQPPRMTAPSAAAAPQPRAPAAARAAATPPPRTPAQQQQQQPLREFDESAAFALRTERYAAKMQELLRCACEQLLRQRALRNPCACVRVFVASRWRTLCVLALALTRHAAYRLCARCLVAPSRSLMQRMTSPEDAPVRALCDAALAQLRRFGAREQAAYAEPRAARAAYGDAAVRVLTDELGSAHAVLFNAVMAANMTVHAREETAGILAALKRATAAAKPLPTTSQAYWRDTPGAEPIADILSSITEHDNPGPLRDSGLDAGGVEGRGLSSTWLHAAAQEGATACVAYIIGAGACVNVRDAIGDTPAHNAARENRVDALRQLLAAGADVRAQNFLNYTPLHVACQGGHADCVRLLCEAGSPINTRSLNDAFTPAMTALSCGCAAALEYLLHELPAVPGGEVVDITARKLPPNEAHSMLRRSSRQRSAMRRAAASWWWRQLRRARKRARAARTRMACWRCTRRGRGAARPLAAFLEPAAAWHRFSVAARATCRKATRRRGPPATRRCAWAGRTTCATRAAWCDTRMAPRCCARTRRSCAASSFAQRAWRTRATRRASCSPSWAPRTRGRASTARRASWCAWDGDALCMRCGK